MRAKVEQALVQQLWSGESHDQDGMRPRPHRQVVDEVALTRALDTGPVATRTAAATTAAPMAMAAAGGGSSGGDGGGGGTPSSTPFALAAGCTVVLKPAEQTPLSALALAAAQEDRRVILVEVGEQSRMAALFGLLLVASAQTATQLCARDLPHASPGKVTNSTGLPSILPNR